LTDVNRPSPLRLLIVDDHEVVRQGLVALLDRREGFQVVAEAGTVAEAVEQARKFEPDIVVMDVRLPDGSGIEACREIRADLPGTRVVMLRSTPERKIPRVEKSRVSASMMWPTVSSPDRPSKTCRRTRVRVRKRRSWRLLGASAMAESIGVSWLTRSSEAIRGPSMLLTFPAKLAAKLMTSPCTRVRACASDRGRGPRSPG